MPTSNSRKTLFFIGPQQKSSEQIYFHVATAATIAGINAVRVNSLFGSSATSITEEIEKVIMSASLVVADITDVNPNVMYELGLATAKNKPLILVASSSRSIPSSASSSRWIQCFISKTW